MQAARGRGAAAVAAAVRGALRASTRTPTTRPFPPATSPGPPGFLYLDFVFFPQPRGRGCDNEGKRGARGGSSLAWPAWAPFAGRGRAPEARGTRWPDYQIDFPFLRGSGHSNLPGVYSPGTRIFLGFTVEISARDECKGEGME